MIIIIEMKQKKIIEVFIVSKQVVFFSYNNHHSSRIKEDSQP